VHYCVGDSRPITKQDIDHDLAGGMHPWEDGLGVVYVSTIV
jgi:hypothetical protein